MNTNEEVLAPSEVGNSVKVGDLVKITAIGPEDAYHGNAEDYIGLVGTVKELSTLRSEQEHFAGRLSIGEALPYFFDVSLVILEPAPHA